MEREIMDNELAAALLNRADEVLKARIFEGNTQRPFSIQRVTYALDTAVLSTRPIKLGFPFRSVYIEDATDTSVSITMRPNSMDDLQSGITLKKNDAWSNDFPIAEAYLHWSAQSGKTITLVFLVTSEFRSGSQISVNSGGVSINDGSAVSAITRVTLSAATAAIIAPSDSTRKKTTIQNKTGGNLYIGGTSAVTNSGATEGIKVPNDGIIYWQNTAALYGYSDAGGNVHYMTES